jgi:hypothetical protein
MTTRISAACLAAAAAIAAGQVSAHHSFGAEYDVNQPITLQGVVTKIEWTNPHSHLFLDVKDANGKVVNWQLEGYPPNALQRMGFKRDTVKVGDAITVSGWRARDGGAWGHSREITLAGGDKFIFGPPAGTGDGGATPAVDR